VIAPYLVIFFISGASGLVYEVVWTRLLGLSIGHTTVALTAVVAASMGGLGAGSVWIGRVLRRQRPALLVYASLEAGIAILALAFPLVLQAVTWFSAEAGRTFERGSVSLAIARFLVALLAVAPATFLMGGTLPTMLEAVPSRSRDRKPDRAGLLYAVNTAGAVTGAALAGFVLIERLGTFETTWLAAGGNLVAAAVAAALWHASADRLRGEAPEPTRKERTAPIVRTETTRSADLSFSYLLSGFAAMTMQIVWTRALVFYAGSTTYAFASMLVVFLAGLAAGSALIAPWIARMDRPERAFILAQAALAATAAMSLRLLQVGAPAIDAIWNPEQSWAALTVGSFAKAAVAMAVPTVLMGVLFPIAVHLLPTDARHAHGPATSGEALGRLYAFNTFGGIAGATLAGLFLLPAVGIGRALGCACAATVIAAGVILWYRARRVLEAAVVVVTTLFCVWIGWSHRPLHVVAGTEQLVFYEEGASGTVSVLQEVTGTRTIYIDRVPVAGTDAIMLTDQKSLAHIPMLLNPSARRVLTVGFGSGGASWSFAQHRSLERIDAVEIDPTVFRAAPYLRDSNHGVWEDRRFHLILEDARNYLASTDATYDVISTDCTDLRYKSNASLYTVDYFSLVRDRLNPRGIVTVWMPLGGLGGDTFRMALRTFVRVFPHTTVWYMTNQPTHYLLLVGSDHRVEPDVSDIAAGVADPQIHRDLAEIRLDDPFKVASSLLLDEQETSRLAGEGPLNTDRRPLLEFQAPRLAYRDALATNLRAVAGARQPSERLSRWRTSEEGRRRLAPFVAATPALVEGHARYQQGTFDYAGALRLYRAAARLNPGDRSIPALIADVEHTRAVWLSEYESRVEDGSQDVRDWLAHATLLRQTGKLDQAVASATRATALAPNSSEAWLRLAAIQAQNGSSADAVATLERATRLMPDDPLLLSDLGAAFNEGSRYAEAEVALRRSLALRSTADAHNNLGVALNGLERPGDAVREFGAALALNSASAEAWFNLGVAQAMLGEPGQARVAYQRGLALMPGEPRALANLAMLEAQAGRLDLTVRYLRDAVAQTPSPALYNDLGRALLGLGRPDEAVEALEQALRLDPSSAAVKENLTLAAQQRENAKAQQRTGARR
jgi:spermidine synthase